MLLEVGFLLVLQNGTEVADSQPSTSEPTSSVVLQEPNQYLSPASPSPQDPNTPLYWGDWPWGSDGMTGDWGGLRPELADHGVFLGGTYTTYLMDNFSGGFDTGFFGAGAVNAMLTIDTEKLIGLDGGTFFFNYQYASWFNRIFEPSGQYNPTGSWLGSMGNLLFSDDTDLNQVAQLYYEQALFEDTLSVAFGKIDANTTFSDVQGAGGFQYAAASYNGTLDAFIPSYPSEAIGIQLSWDVTEHITGKFACFDGSSVAFNGPNEPIGPNTGSHGPSTFFNNDGHWFFITEWDVAWELDPERPGSVGVGAWLQSGTTATSGNSTTGVTDVPGLYVQASQIIWAPNEHIANEGGGITLFGQYGVSRASKNPVQWSIMGGVSATGVIPGRTADALGILFAYSKYSNDPAIYQSVLQTGQPGPSGGSESCLEAFYLLQVTPALSIQPGLQWIRQPGGGNPAPIDDAFAGYLIITVDF